MRTTVALLLFTVCSAAHADEQGPCQKLEAACADAGFVKGGHRTHQGIDRDCMKPLLAGQFVDHVLVTSGEIEACKAARHQHPRKAPASTEQP